MAYFTARYANELSKNSSKLIDIEHKVQEEIQSAIDNGEFYAKVPIAKETPQIIRDKIFGILSSFNYDVSIQTYSEERVNDPNYEWYDDLIEISWLDK